MWKVAAVALLLLVIPARLIASESGTPPAPQTQTPEAAKAKSAGCISCHSASDAWTMHKSEAVVLGCTDCHGGNAGVVATGLTPADPAYAAARDAAHVRPRDPKAWNYPSSANPKRSYTLLNREAPAFIRFMNPSDYRVARQACGACHLDIIEAAERSLMATGAMLWGGAAYNNGVLPYKSYVTGEAYTRDGQPAKLLSPGTPPGTVTPQQAARGALPSLYPLPTWQTTPPADIFRTFERGGRTIGSQFPDIAQRNPSATLQTLDEDGRPDLHQSNRGPGTGLRIAMPVLTLHKTRLNDPLMWFIGTNDQPGDYRQSGCAGCHVVYANDRDPKHSSVWAGYGRDGQTATVDPMIAGLKPAGHPLVGEKESGHPIEHAFTRAVPTAQCMTCHMHQPNVFLNSFLGNTMWDYEADAPLMWPERQKYPDATHVRATTDRNPEAAAARGKWDDQEFLRRVYDDVNPKAKDTQFADYHGHGWNFRAVYKRDREGNLLDAAGKIVPPDDPEKFRKAGMPPFAPIGQQAGKAVHLMDIHAEKGMQCADCHFAQDSHGNGLIYGEVADAVEIGCKDCHGTADAFPALRTSGPAARPGGTDLSLLRNPDGRRRFEWSTGAAGERILIQRSIVDPKLEWRVSLVKNSVDRSLPEFNAKAARAKLMGKSGVETGTFAFGPGVAPADRAHASDKMACYTCHLSWTTSCGGCHLPSEANWKTASHHFGKDDAPQETRNFATYNPQVARDDMFQLGIHATTKGNEIAPVRSSSALVLSATNINRERITVQQPPISAIGFSAQAFAPHFPHTVRTTETKQCSDCHLAAANDNNAIMAQLMLLGTGGMNFVGLNAWLGLEGGIEAVRVTEWQEPQAVIGSYLQKYAFPDYYRLHVERNKRELIDWNRGKTLDGKLSGERDPIEPFRNIVQHGGSAGCVQLRGEYLFVAEGRNGFRAYDVASIANKGVSQKIVASPVSPLGQQARVPSANATCMALPTNQSIAPMRNTPLMRAMNQEQPFDWIYHYAVVTDARVGLILVNVDTLSDGNPGNNFLKRALTWNPGNVLAGARHVLLAGHIAYIAADAGLVVVDLADPLHPRLAATVPLDGARASAIQFRYLWVTTAQGLRVLDVTHLLQPKLLAAIVPLADARRVYVSRTYAYVAAGKDGLVIVNVTNPEAPAVYAKETFGGQMTDASDVVVGATNASFFAYVADGRNGLKVIQLTSPASQPNFYGFSPAPKPELIAWAKTPSPARAVSRGLDRDRAVDETGGQIAVFGRLGSRPFTRAEMERFFLNARGVPWKVSDVPDLKDWAK